MFSEFLTQNLIWVAAFVIVANMLVFSFIQGRVSGVSGVSVLKLPQLQRGGKSVIIDVCEEGIYSKSHIPDAVNFPIGSLNDENKELMNYKDHTTVLVSQSGTRSAKAAKSLQKIGFSDLHILQGGMVSWVKENLPTTSS